MLRNKIAFSFLVFGLFYTPIVFAQSNDVPIDSWRVHVPYINTEHVVDAGDKIYVSTPASLASVNKADGSREALSTVDGLSSNAISAIAWDEARQQLIVGYRTGEIDFVTDRSITSLTFIKDFNITSNKAINHIHITGDTAYLSTGFGVALMKISEKKIFDEVTALGSGNKTIAAYATTTNKDSIYIGTQEGLIIMPRNLATMRDNTKWDRAFMGFPVWSLAFYDSKLYFSREKGTGGYWCYRPFFIYERENGVTTALSIDPSCDYSTVTATNKGILFGLVYNHKNRKGLIHYFPDSQTADTIKGPFSSPAEIVLDDNGTYWVADRSNGLIANPEDNFTYFPIQGPANSNFFNFEYQQNRMYVFTGGHRGNRLEPSYRRDGFFYYQDGNWTSYTPALSNLPPFTDVVDGVYDPATNKHYFASFHDGFIVFDANDGSYEVHNKIVNPDIPVHMIVDKNYKSTRVAAVEQDKNGKIWMAVVTLINDRTSSPMLVSWDKNTKEWQSYTINTNSGYARGLLIDEAGNKWMWEGIERGTRTYYGCPNRRSCHGTQNIFYHRRSSPSICKRHGYRQQWRPLGGYQRWHSCFIQCLGRFSVGGYTTIY